MHLNGKFFEKMIVLKTVNAKVIIITRHVQANETMPINKFHMSRLPFQPMSLILESHQCIKT